MKNGEVEYNGFLKEIESFEDKLFKIHKNLPLEGDDSVEFSSLNHDFRTFSRSTEKAFIHENMKKLSVLETENGFWVKLSAETDQNGQASKISQTGISAFIKMRPEHEQEQDINWLVLIDKEENKGVVSMALWPENTVIPEGSWLKPWGHVTGYQNSDPYPKYADDIKDVAEHLGLQYTPNLRGRRAVLEAGDEGPTP